MRPRTLVTAAEIAAADDDGQPVMVPRNDRVPGPTSPDRVRRLRLHVVKLVRRVRGTQTAAPPAPQPPDPVGFPARVVRTACTMCKGWCCKGGGDHGYLDEPTLARVRSERPELTAKAVVQLYIERAPSVAYQGSCIFHGKRGCTLDRSMRSDVCNLYFCSGLDMFLTGDDTATPVVVIAGEGERMQVSRTLNP